MKVIQSMFGSGGGGGWGGKGGGGKGGGWGRRNIGMVRRTAKTSPEKVVWIGGLEGKEIDKDLNKKLKAHIEKLCGDGVKFVEIHQKGHGGAIFGSGAEAQMAI